jgi:hypothetical protein
MYLTKISVKSGAIVIGNLKDVKYLPNDKYSFYEQEDEIINKKTKEKTKINNTYLELVRPQSLVGLFSYMIGNRAPVLSLPQSQKDFLNHLVDKCKIEADKPFVTVFNRRRNVVCYEKDLISAGTCNIRDYTWAESQDFIEFFQDIFQEISDQKTLYGFYKLLESDYETQGNIIKKLKKEGWEAVKGYIDCQVQEEDLISTEGIKNKKTLDLCNKINEKIQNLLNYKDKDKIELSPLVIKFFRAFQNKVYSNPDYCADLKSIQLSNLTPIGIKQSKTWIKPCYYSFVGSSPCYKVNLNYDIFLELNKEEATILYQSEGYAYWGENGIARLYKNIEEIPITAKTLAEKRQSIALYKLK